MHGQHYSGTTYAWGPFHILDPKTGAITGGIVKDIVDAIGAKLALKVSLTTERDWSTIYPNGSLSGSLKKVRTTCYWLK